MEALLHRSGLVWLLLAALLIGGCGDQDQGGEDFIAPAAVNDLALSSVDQTSVRLSWTATGDDAGSGTADRYDLRFSISTIADSTWSAATPAAGEPSPSEAGQPESFAVGGLDPGTTYSFALKVADEKQNWSDLSNVVAGTTVTHEGDDQSWWDGFLYEGMNGPVYALAVHEGRLIAGGAFTEAGKVDADRVAAWDGTTWTRVGAGMNAEIWTLAVYDGDLIAGGSFTIAGEQPTSFIARWTGEGWVPLGRGMNNLVLALTVWDGKLIAGGFFTEAGGAAVSYVAGWDGDSWSPIAGLDGAVYSLTTYNGDLIAGGRFVRAGGVDVNEIARFNGSGWGPLGNGLFVSPPRPSASALAVYGSALAVGGYFSSAGEVPALQIALWNGVAWEGLGLGMNEEVLALASYGGLVAGGKFTEAGEVPAAGIARWDGTSWRTLASGLAGGMTIVYALAEFEGSLFVGGSFDTAGMRISQNIARWDD